jgi:hypothetical protein
METGENQREAFRYVFKGTRHLPMDFKQKAVNVRDISAGGMAFKNEGFIQYDVDQITIFLHLPNFVGDGKFTAQLRILNINNNGICHCIFENCTIEEYEMIHKYVLEIQKMDLIPQAKYKRE